MSGMQRLLLMPYPRPRLVVSILVVALGLVDYATGSEISFSVFYLLPVALATWWISRRAGLLLSLASALVWLLADRLSGGGANHALISLWNCSIRLAFFVAFVEVGSHLRASLDREAALLAKIQRDLLPDRLPAVEGVVMAARWLPAQSVGGDYYDVRRLSPNRVAVCIADVVGKGTAAALIMSNVQAAVRALTVGDTSPRRLCGELNRALCENLAAGRFVTFFYAVLDSRRGTLVYTNAGHMPALLSRGARECEELRIGGPPLGILPDASYRQAVVRLAPGDRLLLYTDGLTESTDRFGEEFGIERLARLLFVFRALPASYLTDALLRSVTTFHHDGFQDDVALLAVAYEGASGRIRHRRRGVAGLAGPDPGNDPPLAA